MTKFQQNQKKLQRENNFAKNNFIKTDTSESKAESTPTKFLHATIETLPVALLDELLKTISIKSMKSKKFENNFKKGSNQLT